MCFDNFAVFLAKTWKTVKGRRYESWVLKKAVWDKRRKRYRQVYLAYIGKSRRISVEKAREICRKLGITLDELCSVNRLTVVAGPPAELEAQRREVEAERPTPPEVPVPRMIRELRRRFGLGPSFQDYQELATRIGRLHVGPDELRLVEAGQTVLPLPQQRHIEKMWRTFVKGGWSEAGSSAGPDL